MKPLLSVVCTICVSLSITAATQADDEGSFDYMNVEINGDLRTGLVAIGGETTGSDITAKGWRFELDYPNDDMAALADRLARTKHAQVLGTFRLVKGVELPDRWVLDVKKIRATPRDMKPSIKVAIYGAFHADDVIAEKRHDTISTRGIKWQIDLSMSFNPAGLKALLIKKEHVHLGGELKAKSGDTPPELVVTHNWADKQPRLTDFSK